MKAAAENLVYGKRKAISNFLNQFATIIDIEKRAYKIQQGLLGIFHWGKFRPLPKIDYVLVFRSLFVKCEACEFGEGENNPNAWFQVSLVYNSNRRIIVHETRKKEEALSLARVAASGLHTRIKDSATNPRKGMWLS
jgi:hypothetical protein